MLSWKYDAIVLISLIELKIREFLKLFSEE